MMIMTNKSYKAFKKSHDLGYKFAKELAKHVDVAIIEKIAKELLKDD